MMRPISPNNTSRRARPGFTLLEMLTTAAAMVILLGLMVSLARHVRNASAVELTNGLLLQLDAQMSQYQAENHGALPNVAPCVVSDADLRRLQTFMGFELGEVRVSVLADGRKKKVPVLSLAPFLANVADLPNTEQNELALQKAALENNRQVIRLMRYKAGNRAGVPTDTFRELSDAVYDQAILRDAWGTPIVYMPAMHPAIGMAPQDHRFFFSAGPDHKFLTQEDNLYSYEKAGHPE